MIFMPYLKLCFGNNNQTIYKMMFWKDSKIMFNFGQSIGLQKLRISNL